MGKKSAGAAAGNGGTIFGWASVQLRLKANFLLLRGAYGTGAEVLVHEKLDGFAVEGVVDWAYAAVEVADPSRIPTFAVKNGISFIQPARRTQDNLDFFPFF